MVRNRSGVTVSTAWPAAPRLSTSMPSVRTTPLTCGDQASETSAMRKRSGRHQLPRAQLHRVPVDPLDDFQPAVEMLDQGGAALDPVAVVAIKHAADVANLGAMDVAEIRDVGGVLYCNDGDWV